MSAVPPPRAQRQHIEPSINGVIPPNGKPHSGHRAVIPDRFHTCLDLIGWSQRWLANQLQMDERQVRCWAAGATIPDRISAWLETLADCHERHPPPPRA